MLNIRLLMIDDNADDRELYAQVLRYNNGSNLEFHGAESFESAMQLYRTHAPFDCLLLDYNLPGCDGPSLLLRLREELGELPCACIMLTGSHDQRAVVESIKAGAWDYLIKDRVAPEELRLAVERAKQVTLLQRELAAQNEQWQAASSLIHAAELQAAEMEGVRKTVATYMHELNSPLTGLLNCVLLLLDEGPTPEQRLWLAEMLEACQRMTNVLRRLEAIEVLRPRPGAGPHGPLDLGHPGDKGSL